MAPQILRVLVALLACGVAASAGAQAVTAEDLARTARLSGDAIVADACHLRPHAWSVIAVPAITMELDRQARNLSPSGGVRPEDVTAFLYASLNQGVDEGNVQVDRYGQAACTAIAADGSLARIDALVAAFKRAGQ